MTANIFFGSEEISRENLESRINPYSNEIVSKYPLCTKEDTIRALEIANSASKDTKASTLSQRINWLKDVVKKLTKNKEDIAQTLCDEVGKPITYARIEVDRCIETLKLSNIAMVSSHGETINTDAMESGKKTTAYWFREPVGVVACITPFNFPLNLVAHKVAPALVSGNAVVLKPTPEAPLTAYKFIKLFIESEYAIKDAISLVYGDVEVGSTLVESMIPRVLSFTGSVPVGNIITKSAGIKKVALELGGNAATFIDKSADLELAAQRCAFGAFVNSGQVCISLQRIYVAEEVYEEFAKLMKIETEKLVVGSPYNDDTFIGPLIDEESLNRAKSWCASAIEEGAVCIAGNKADGMNFHPTVMTEVTDDMKIICEEVFAPIVSLVKIKSYDEAIVKMNNSPYGLQFSIFTNDLKQTQQFIHEADCGGVVINDIPTLRFDIQPYGGTKLSGVGKEGPSFAIEEFTEIKSVVIC
ncbi:MAG: aldehyde dehydrogenase family protein [Campylobacteraceae bacterium]|jgi:acyl-CoA reductase-like NAD-dependent aldehyde dehydrogenase|nr:aldehyde dehydrogenase family protein [Campylobacteraceae bacterium]MBT3881806.1 aldehyde dehydrogenase family protein [Campylobacteraceae bacterium]MBT4030573.1 aldehyde dehydrogenase family protein [Campylobacteraceae bacterium]MBT4179308.1 aldehyde dehydrogenase family protein [Campylobacteraceae bacterium]MBT4572428.1 aldehyde dehydrogenase family protein [Campylobacteraceae bacterium]